MLKKGIINIISGVNKMNNKSEKVITEYREEALADDAAYANYNINDDVPVFASEELK